MSLNTTSSVPPLVQSPEGACTPTLSLNGLADLLLALEPELLALPGAIPVLSNTLRELLLEAVDDDHQ